MDNNNPKLCVIITRDGVESITVHANDQESRQAGYEACVKLEPVLQDASRIMTAIYAQPEELVAQ